MPKKKMLTNTGLEELIDRRLEVAQHRSLRKGRWAAKVVTYSLVPTPLLRVRRKSEALKAVLRKVEDTGYCLLL